MSLKTLTLAFAAGLLASKAYAKLQQNGALDSTAPGSDNGEYEFDDESITGNGNLSLTGGERLRAERLGSGVLGEAPNEQTEPYRANDANLFGSTNSNSERTGVPSVPDLTRGV